MLRLAAPVLAEQFLHMFVGFSDTLLTGWYFSTEHLAAINLMAYLAWLLNNFFMVVAIGATAMVARFSGAKDLAAARHVANQAILVGAVIALPLTVLGVGLAGPVAVALGLGHASAPLAGQYLRIVFLALPAIMLEVVGLACLRGRGDTLSALWVMAVVNAVNIALSWGLVLGFGPLPELGWEGIAVGTACGHAVGGLLVLGLLIAGRAGLRLKLTLLRPDASLLRRLLRIGVPGGIDSLSVTGFHLWFVAIVNKLGDTAAAAHGVAIRIEGLAWLPGIAFHVAAATLAGQYLGARDPHRASRAALVACMVGGAIMTAAGVTFYAAATQSAGLLVPVEADETPAAVNGEARPAGFGGDRASSAAASRAEVVTLAAQLLRIVAFSMPPLAVAMILTGALRGAGDTRAALLITLIGYAGVRIPLAYILTGLGLGVHGAWYAMVLDIVVRAGLVGWRFLEGGWRRIEV